MMPAQQCEWGFLLLFSEGFFVCFFVVFQPCCRLAGSQFPEQGLNLGHSKSEPLDDQGTPNVSVFNATKLSP